MKMLKWCARAWLALVVVTLLVWALTGIWLLHSPAGDGAAFLMGLGLVASSIICTFFLAEVSP